MKKIAIVLVAFILVFSVACKKDKKETETPTDAQVENSDVETNNNTTTTSTSNSEENKLKVALSAKSNSGVSGNAVFKEDNGVVTMIAVFSGLSEGMHAIHLHEKADCSSEDGTSTGGHWNPTKEPHGKWGAETGYHKGDIGNFTANASGQGTITFITSEWCIGCGDPAKDILGKAIIVHQGVDDFTSQPTGAAGGRVSCGGIIQ
ncbi:MAG: superoxide dismutase family protein [Flavobacteriaceae bacterium]|nr:superoxide dismutase family protein [Flavobacteriaceae bacterium]